VIQDKTFENWHASGGSMSNLSHQSSEIKSKNYMVDPTEKRERTEEFMNSTEGDLSFSKRPRVNLALYYFELVGESMIKILALALSTPITSVSA
jgi:hypothetical protein